MDKFWDMTIDFLAKINTWIPLVTVLWAGLGLIGVVLILAIAGCAVRKRLVPQYLIWIYFIFATLIIFAQADGNIFTVVENMEVPCLVVLICYLLRLLFYRRPRYTYVKRAVYAREIDKTPVVKEVKEEKEEKEQKEDTAREVETTVVEEIKINEVITDENQAEVKEDKEVDQEKNQAAAEEKTKVETKVEVEDKQEDQEEDQEEYQEEYKEEYKEEVAEKAEENTTVDMPVVEPIPDKTYEAPREPGIVTTPVSETIPELKSTIATASRPSTTVARPSTTVARPSVSSLSSANRSSASSMLAARSNATASTTANLNRPATTTTGASTTAARPNAFASMYNPRMVKTTTTTTTTTTTNTNSSANTLNATASSSSVRATSGLATGVNRTASATTTSTPKNPRSTDDIMAAIARLRASMKK